MLQTNVKQRHHNLYIYIKKKKKDKLCFDFFHVHIVSSVGKALKPIASDVNPVVRT